MDYAYNFGSVRLGLVTVLTAALWGPPVVAETSLCQDSVAQSVSSTSAASKKNGADPVSIVADEIEFPQRNVVLLKGYTQLVKGGHRVFADELLYNKGSQSVEARGLVKFETPTGDYIRTSVLHYDVVEQRAESGPASFVLASRDATSKISPKDPDSPKEVSAHGTASRVEFRGENTMYLEKVLITTCLNGKEDITFKADNLEIDLDQGFQFANANRTKLQILAPDRHPQLKEMLN